MSEAERIADELARKREASGKRAKPKRSAKPNTHVLQGIKGAYARGTKRKRVIRGE